MPVFTVHHTTTYRYRQPVGFGAHRLMLRPLETRDQKLLAAELRIIRNRRVWIGRRTSLEIGWERRGFAAGRRRCVFTPASALTRRHGAPAIRAAQAASLRVLVPSAIAGSGVSCAGAMKMLAGGDGLGAFLPGCRRFR
jgi:hypothetical protein